MGDDDVINEQTSLKLQPFLDDEFLINNGAFIDKYGKENIISLNNEFPNLFPISRFLIKYLLSSFHNFEMFRSFVIYKKGSLKGYDAVLLNDINDYLKSINYTNNNEDEEDFDDDEISRMFDVLESVQNLTETQNIDITNILNKSDEIDQSIRKLNQLLTDSGFENIHSILSQSLDYTHKCDEKFINMTSEIEKYLNNMQKSISSIKKDYDVVNEHILFDNKDKKIADNLLEKINKWIINNGNFVFKLLIISLFIIAILLFIIYKGVV